jgi:hypothetical protein
MICCFHELIHFFEKEVGVRLQQKEKHADHRHGHTSSFLHHLFKKLNSMHLFFYIINFLRMIKKILQREQQHFVLPLLMMIPLT